MKFLGLSLLASVGYATEVTSVSCNGETTMTIVITSGSSITGWSLPDCDTISPTIDDSVGGQYTVTLNPYECTGTAGAIDPNDVTSYNTQVDLLFAASDTIEGVQIYSGNNRLTASCAFETSYTVETDIGTITAQENVMDGADKIIAFSMMVMEDQTYAAEKADKNYITGNTVYITILEQNTFDFANSKFEYTPTTCRVMKSDEEAKVITVWDTSANDKCELTQVNFSINYDTASGEWRFEFTSFMFDATGSHNLKVECDIELCHEDATGSGCVTARNNCISE